METVVVSRPETKNNKAIYIAYAQMLLTAFSWAFSTILIKLYIGAVPALHLLTGRALIALIVLLLVFPKRIAAVNKEEIKTGLLLGVIIFVAYFLGIVCLKYTSASKAGFLIALPVLFIPIIQTIARRKLPSKWIVLSVALSLVGLKLISGMNGSNFNRGDLLAIGCALFYSVYILYLDKYGKGKDDYRLTVLQLAAIAGTGLLTALLFEGIHLSYFKAGLLPIIIIGIFGTGLPTLFQTRAQKIASPESIGILQLGEPLFTLIMAYLIIHETILFSGLVGSAFILFSLVLVIIKKT